MVCCALSITLMLISPSGECASASCCSFEVEAFIAYASIVIGLTVAFAPTTVGPAFAPTAVGPAFASTTAAGAACRLSTHVAYDSAASATNVTCTSAAIAVTTAATAIYSTFSTVDVV